MHCTLHTTCSIVFQRLMARGGMCHMSGDFFSDWNASTISIVKEAPTMLDPDLLNITRFTIAAIPFVLFLLKSIRDMQVVIRGVELGILVTLAYLTQSIGLVTADAGRASFISALTVIIVPFLDGIIATTFCLWAEIVAMRDVSATETAIIYGLEPVWGATFAWAIHGERWDITGLIGAVFIIAGSLMVQVLGSFLDIDVSEDSYQMNS
ncbi:hypothetical protein ZWY2020_050284 [Hordeum vulgare]|nr:hypothetical protein ZWY2020_050284 [Hordeum vulgare]